MQLDVREKQWRQSVDRLRHPPMCWGLDGRRAGVWWSQ